MNNKRLSPEERKLEIVQNTARLISEGLYNSLTRDFIAEQCNIAPSLITHYFGDIRALRYQALDMACTQRFPHAVVVGLQLKNKVAMALPLEVRHDAINEVLL